MSVRCPECDSDLAVGHDAGCPLDPCGDEVRGLRAQVGALEARLHRMERVSQELVSAGDGYVAALRREREVMRKALIEADLRCEAATGAMQRREAYVADLQEQVVLMTEQARLDDLRCTAAAEALEAMEAALDVLAARNAELEGAAL